MIFPIFMPAGIKSVVQLTGLALYISGALIYFISWIILICFPFSKWSRSKAGFLAPAYTPVLWLAGIGMMTGSFLWYDSYWFSIIYMVLSAVFLIFHISHVLKAFESDK